MYLTQILAFLRPSGSWLRHWSSRWSRMLTMFVHVDPSVVNCSSLYKHSYARWSWCGQLLQSLQAFLCTLNLVRSTAPVSTSILMHVDPGAVNCSSLYKHSYARWSWCGQLFQSLHAFLCTLNLVRSTAPVSTSILMHVDPGAVNCSSLYKHSYACWTWCGQLLQSSQALLCTYIRLKVNLIAQTSQENILFCSCSLL